MSMRYLRHGAIEIADIAHVTYESQGGCDAITHIQKGFQWKIAELHRNQRKIEIVMKNSKSK